MAGALALARRGLGTVAPNPAVGCVLVKDGVVVGRGWTQAGGRPHAETEALCRAGDKARGATAYVTLEPCAHTGQTPPCANALVEAGIKRCVVATTDPDPRVAGQGIEILEQAGIAVVQDVCKDQADAINQGFFLTLSEKRPLFTLKVASTLDGRIAMQSGESQWITGPEAREQGHLLRANHDAIFSGIGTVKADNPSLTCRLPGLEGRSPVRVISDRHLNLPLDGALAQSARAVPVWLVTVAGHDADKRRALEEIGVEIIEVSGDDSNRPDLGMAARALADRGITRVLVESGGMMNAAFLQAGLIDRVVWFRAAKIIGGEGIPAVAHLGLEKLSDSLAYERVSVLNAGPDLMETYHRRPE